MKKGKGFYSISVVAKMFAVHQQTIRMYEKEGLITPKRSAGNTRLFSEEDVDRLEEVIYLTHKLGVNLAGVQMILKLKKKVKRMQDEMNKMFTQAQGQLDQEVGQLGGEAKEQFSRLVQIKRESLQPEAMRVVSGRGAKANKADLSVVPAEPKVLLDDDHDDVIDDWKIDYDDLDDR